MFRFPKKPKKIKAIPFDINITEPMSYYDVVSKQNLDLEITCISYSYEIKFKFKSFQGMENRDEFFSPEEKYDIEIKNISDNSGFSFPIFYIEFKDFEFSLSGYEFVHCDENTKKWYFLSMTNYLIVYSNLMPEVIYKKIQN